MLSGSRLSTVITRKQIADIMDACTFAWRQDMPLNRSLTFNLKTLTIRPQAFISEFTKLCGDWLRISGNPRAYVWVLEHPPGQSLNLHMLMHVPENLMDEFMRKERGWMTLAGMKWRERALKSKRVGRRPDRTEGEYLSSLEWCVRYMLKGGDPETCDTLCIDYWKQGEIVGKRTGVAECIGRKARQRVGYKVERSLRSGVLFSERHRLDGG